MPSHRSSRFAVGLLVVALGLLAIAPNATAAFIRANPAAFGTDGTSGTSFGDPHYLAFNQANDQLYVLDKSPARIHAFDAPALTLSGGAFPLAVATTGGSPGLAVDNTLGGTADNIYYVSNDTVSGRRIYGFDSAGVPLGGNFPITPTGATGICSAAVDSAGNIFVGDFTAEAVRRYDSGGNALASIDVSAQGTSPCGLAFDSNDDLYVGLGSNGTWKRTAASGYTDATVVDTGNSRVVAVDTSTDTVYVAHTEDVVAYDSAGTVLYGFGIHRASFRGITVDEGTDTVYVSSNPSGNRKVYAFGPAQNYADATGTPTAAMNIDYFSADIAATIDDNGPLPTNWRLEISADDGFSWRSVRTGFTAGNEVGAVASGTARGLLLGTDYRFRVVTNKGTTANTEVPSSTLSFRTTSHPNATAVLGAAANVTESSADIAATIDDNGPLPTTWRFELSSDGGASWSTVASGATAGNEVGAAVSKSLTGLVPNTDYRFRIVTNKQPDPISEVASRALSFRADSVPPVVSNVGAIDVQDTSARMVGTIDPRNSDTGYVFEYGTTPALGSSTAPLGIGHGFTPQVFSQVVGGLRPDTTYYFKLRATNAFGSTSSPQETFHTRAGAVPAADARAFEQVSPVDKNGGGALVGILNIAAGAAYDGDGIGFCTTSLVGDPAPPQYVPPCSTYASLRGPGGWQTKPAHPPACLFDTDDPAQVFPRLPVTFSRDYKSAAIGQPEFADCPFPSLDPAAPQPITNLYREDLTAAPTAYQLLAPELPFAAPRLTLNTANYAAASDDFSHVVYTSSGQQLGGGPGDAPAGNFDKIYEWDNGALRLVSVDTGGTPLGTASTIATDARNAVSADGGRIFFRNPTSGASQEIYMREGGTRTHWVSQQECTPACSDGGAADNFAHATPDGEKVLFTTTARRTDDDTSSSGADLYLYTHSGNPAVDPNLTLLSQDNENIDGTSAAVQSVLGASDDGETVFFTASGQLVLGKPTGAGTKIYRWRHNGGSPTIEYLGSASGGGQVSADGSALALQTTAQIDPVGDQDGDRDIYHWRESRGWVCASCQLPGTTSAGESDFGGRNSGGISGEGRINISDDGRRVFFETYDALLPDDVNGARDVYEWHDGRLNLISTGTDPGGTPGSNVNLGVSFIGASHDGRDVFFVTDERLVGWDTDFANDIYDARIGGGFPEPPAQPPACEGDACRGAGTGSPEIAGAGTRAFEGPGTPPSDASSTCGRFSKKAQRKARIAKRAARKGQSKRARVLRKQASNLNRRAKRCNRRQGR